ncbi:MAG: hypothetical protein V3573_11015 [Desulfovibrionaceae bacterium]
MRKLSKLTEPARDAMHLLPFEGLGHALDAVRAVARDMFVIRYCTPEKELSESRCAFAVPHLSGYALLTALGREIRGR